MPNQANNANHTEHTQPMCPTNASNQIQPMHTMQHRRTFKISMPFRKLKPTQNIQVVVLFVRSASPSKVAWWICWIGLGCLSLAVGDGMLVVNVRYLGCAVFVVIVAVVVLFGLSCSTPFPSNKQNQNQWGTTKLDQPQHIFAVTRFGWPVLWWWHRSMRAVV